MDPTPKSPPTESPRLSFDVFISYAREDRSFVEHLQGALASAGLRAWVDWEGIPASATWMAEVRAAIDQARAFCFVISPDSVTSAVCIEESVHAARGGKRIIPVLLRPVDDALVSPSVAAHHWIDFSEDDSFEEAFDTLRRAIEVDPEHAKIHTRLLVKAKEWEEGAAERSRLLRGTDLGEAEAWLAVAGAKEPSPTALHVAYVLASRRAATRRQRTATGMVAAVLALSLVLSAFAVVKGQEAARQRDAALRAEAVARAQARLASSQSLAAQAKIDMASPATIDRGLLLAVEAFRTQDTPEAEAALMAGVQAAGPLEAVLASGSAESVYAVEMSPSGDIFATFEGGGVTVWDMGSLSAIGTIPTAAVGYPGGAFSPDGSVLAVIDGDGVVLWDVFSLSPRGARLEAPDDVIDLDFVGDGSSLVAAIEEGHPDLATWDLASGETREVRIPGLDWAWSTDVSPDGRLIAVAGRLPFRGFDRPWPADGVFILDARRFRAVGRPLLMSDQQVLSVGFGLDGARVGVAGRSGVRVWDLDSRGSPGPSLGGRRIEDFAFAPDGSVVTTGFSGRVETWDPATGSLIGDAYPLGGAGHDVALTPDGRFIVAAGERGLLVLSTADHSLPGKRFRVPGGVEEITFAPEGDVLAVVSQAGVRLWDANGMEPMDAPLPGTRDAWNLTGVFSPGGDVYAVLDYDSTEVAFWRLDDESWVPHPDMPIEARGRDLSFISQDQLAVASEMGLSLWDVAGSGIVGPAFEMPEKARDGVYEVAASPTSDLIAGSVSIREGGVSTLSVVVWNATTGEIVGDAVREGASSTGDIAFSPDDGIVASAGENDVVLYDVESLRPIGEPLASPGWGRVSYLAFDPGGRYLASSSEGGLAIWDVESRKLIGEIARVFSDVAFRPGTRELVWEHGDLYRWSIDPASWAVEACQIAHRNLTRDEWDRYVGGDRPYGATCPEFPIP